MDYWPQNQESPYQEYPPHYQYQGYRVPEYSQQYQQLLYPQPQWQQGQQWAAQEKVRPISDKKWLTAFLLFIFLTPFGVHRFYAGKIGTGILQVLMSCGFFIIFPLLSVLFSIGAGESIEFLSFGFLILQMIALLGFAIWTLVDYVLLITGDFKDKNGHPLERKPIYGGNKNWVTTALLCSFLGVFGVHRFYVGKIGTGILQILMSCGFFITFPLLSVLFNIGVGESIGLLLFGFFTLQMLAFFGLSIWVLVDYILILCGEFRDSNGRLLNRPR